MPAEGSSFEVFKKHRHISPRVFKISDQATKIGSSVGIGSLLTVITQEMTIYLKFHHEMSPRFDKMMILSHSSAL